MSTRKRLDPDIRALREAVRGLERSSSERMLRANLEFLWDRYIRRPSVATVLRFQRGRDPRRGPQAG